MISGGGRLSTAGSAHCVNGKAQQLSRVGAMWLGLDPADTGGAVRLLSFAQAIVQRGSDSGLVVR